MTEAQSPMISATLLLEREGEIDADRLVARLGGLLKLDKSLINFGPSGGGMAIVDGEMLITVPLPVPYPANLSGLARFAHWWPTALQDLQRSRAHMTVMCRWSGHSRLDGHLRHMVVVRELIEQLPVIGVLWGSVLTPTDNYKGEFQAAMTKSQVPILVWILIQYSKQPNGNTLISTLGMRDFGHMDIESESSLPMQETYDLVRNLATYIICNSMTFPDGDSVGLSEFQRIKVRHARSFRPDVNEPVLWLELTQTPTVKKPSGFFSNLFGSNSKN